MRTFGPFLTESAILYEDADLVAVNKPAGMPSQAADPAHPDDLATRLERLLAARDGRPTKLGIHQRLDRGTSGVIVFAKSERGNRALTEQFEGRTIRKEYVAAVRGWKGPGRRLEHPLSELVAGRVSVDPRGKPAIATVSVGEKVGDRAILRVGLETGRTHQIRVQLAAEGAPVAGDVVYGATPAPRLMLHAHRLVLTRPADGTELTIVAKVPAVFRDFLAGADAIDPTDARAFEGALRRAVVARASLFESRSDARAIEAFRLLHDEGDGVRDVAVDVYGEHAVLHLYREFTDDEERAIGDSIAALGFAGVYLKRRPVQASTLVDTRRVEVAPREVVVGTPAPDPLVLREHGVPYELRLGDGLSTGIFLDQRDNRRRIRDGSRGARVLNLFAYTGAFSCAAAAGGAAGVTTVDVAAPALATAERSFALGGYAAEHRIVRDDVFAFLDAASRSGERFDRIVCDPPTYSTTKQGRWRSGEDWVRLAEAVFRVCAPGAVVFLCSNDRRMDDRTFRRRVGDGARASGRPVRLRSFDPPTDFPRAPGAEATMKTLRVTLDPG